DGLQRKRGPYISTGVDQEATRGRPDRIEREPLDKENGWAAIDRQLEQRRLTVTIGGDGDPLPVGGPGGRPAHVERRRELSHAASVGVHDVQSRDSASPYRKRELPAVRGNRRSSHHTAIATVPELRGFLSLAELPDALGTGCRRAVQDVVRSESGRQAMRRRKSDANRSRLVDWAFVDRRAPQPRRRPRYGADDPAAIRAGRNGRVRIDTRVDALRDTPFHIQRMNPRTRAIISGGHIQQRPAVH